jgi:hypothetical protein
MEGTQHGVFTALLLQALHGGAANILGKITPGSLYSFVDNALDAWEQRPVFKTNVSQFISLREVSPLIPKEILRKLPEWFAEAESSSPSTPATNLPKRHSTRSTARSSRNCKSATATA